MSDYINLDYEPQDVDVGEEVNIVGSYTKRDNPWWGGAINVHMRIFVTGRTGRESLAGEEVFEEVREGETVELSHSMMVPQGGVSVRLDVDQQRALPNTDIGEVETTIKPGGDEAICRPSYFQGYSEAIDRHPAGEPYIIYGPGDREPSDTLQRLNKSRDSTYELVVRYDQIPDSVRLFGDDYPPDRSYTQQIQDWQTGHLVSREQCDGDWYWVYFPAQLRCIENCGGEDDFIFGLTKKEAMLIGGSGVAVTAGVMLSRR